MSEERLPFDNDKDVIVWVDAPCTRLGLDLQKVRLNQLTAGPVRRCIQRYLPPAQRAVQKEIRNILQTERVVSRVDLFLIADDMALEYYRTLHAVRLFYSTPQAYIYRDDERDLHIRHHLRYMEQCITDRRVRDKLQSTALDFIRFTNHDNVLVEYKQRITTRWATYTDWSVLLAYRRRMGNRQVRIFF